MRYLALMKKYLLKSYTLNTDEILVFVKYWKIFSRKIS